MSGSGLNTSDNKCRSTCSSLPTSTRPCGWFCEENRKNWWLVFALPDQAAPGSNPGLPEIFPRKFSLKKLLMWPRLIEGAAAQSSGQQRLYNINQTHLVLWLVASWHYKRIGKTGSSRQSLGATTDTTQDTLFNLKQDLRKAVSIGTSLAKSRS